MSRAPSDKHADTSHGKPTGLNCARVRSRLWDLTDGALPPDSEQAMRHHLAHCMDCRKAWEAGVRSEQLLASARLLTPSPGDLRAGVYARLASERTPFPDRKGNFLLRWIATPALAAGVLLAAFVRTAPVPQSGVRSPIASVQIAQQPPDLPSQAAVVKKSIVSVAPQGVQGREVGSTAFQSATVHPAWRPHRRSGTTYARVMARRPTPVGSMAPVASALAYAGPVPSNVSLSIRSEQPPVTEAMKPQMTGSNRQLLNGVAATPVATASMAPSGVADNALTPPVSEEQEVHITDEERGFTRSARVLAATNVQEDAQVISVDTDTTQN